MAVPGGQESDRHTHGNHIYKIEEQLKTHIKTNRITENKHFLNHLAKSIIVFSDQ